jgi:hypothetical protein
MFDPFDSWTAVLDHVNASYLTWYWAPLDPRPMMVQCHVRRDGTIRVIPPRGSDADPFTADHGHLERFRRRRIDHVSTDQLLREGRY